MTILVTSGNEQLAKERLAQLIKELRGQATQREFAKLLGTSYTAIQDWEKQIRLPKENNLSRIAKLKGWSQEDLLLYLYHLDDESQVTEIDPLESIISRVRTLSLTQMEALSRYLNAQLSQIETVQRKSMSCFLSETQKHNLHLLLRASLKAQSPTEAMAKTGIAPDLFTDIFLRNNKQRPVNYADLEKLSGLCCRVIQWRANQCPQVDPEQTYQDQTPVLFNDLNHSDWVTLDSH